jgi:hypothetical protein
MASDQRRDPVALVGRQVVHDHDVAVGQGGGEDLLDIGLEGVAVHRTVENPRGHEAVAAQAAGEGGGLPMTPGDLADQPLADRASPVAAGHLGVGPGLVDEHQLGRIEARLAGLPARAPLGHVRPVTLGGVLGFF